MNYPNARPLFGTMRGKEVKAEGNFQRCPTNAAASRNIYSITASKGTSQTKNGGLQKATATAAVGCKTGRPAQEVFSATIR